MNRNFYSVVLAVVISFAFVAVIVNGATTISTNISTGGTLTVTGNSTLTGNVFATSTLAVTGKAFFYDQLALDNATSDPTADAEGAVYYDSTNKVIRLYNGSNWVTVASSTDALGGLILTDDVGVRFNVVGTNYMALGTTTLPFPAADANALLFLNATTSATVPLVISGFAGQTGDLFRALNPVFTELFAIDNVGNASTSVISTATGAALFVGGYASTTGENGNFATEGTLAVTGTSALTGQLTLTGAGVFNGNVTLGDTVDDVITITGAATTTNTLNVGGDFSVNGNATTTSAGAMTLVSTLGVGTTTPAQEFSVAGDAYLDTAATTTVHIKSSLANTGGCIEMNGTGANAGTVYRIFINGNGAALVVEAGACQSGS